MLPVRYIPENEAVMRAFLDNHPNWQIDSPTLDFPFLPSLRGWVKYGLISIKWMAFFIVRLRKENIKLVSYTVLEQNV